MIEERPVDLMGTAPWLDLVQQALLRLLELLKEVEDRLWKYSQGLRIIFRSHQNG